LQFAKEEIMTPERYVPAESESETDPYVLKLIFACSSVAA